jgi:tetratricopeptide (TPR) repeat protein
MRGKLGESLNSIQKLSRPLEEATTSSLEALQDYTAGTAELDLDADALAAVASFERAVAMDPNFATAYHYFGVALRESWVTWGEAQEYAKQAFHLVDRVSARERAEIALLTTIRATRRRSTRRLTPIKRVSAIIPESGILHNQLSLDLHRPGAIRRWAEGRPWKRLDCSPT